jgi:plasmid maintenance system antidote protein VapI
MTNTKQLKGYIVWKGLTQAELAEKAEISIASFSRKLHNQTEFTQSEIMRISKILDLDNMDIMAIFMN